MPRIVTTGSAARCNELAAALKLRDLAATSLPDQALGALGPDSVDVYVQLPVSDTGSDSGDDATGLEGAARFLRYGILARYEAAVAMRDAISEGGLVVLVPGNTPPLGTPDRNKARGQLLDALAEALRRETADRNVRVIITREGTSTEQLAALVQTGHAEPAIDLSTIAELNPEMDFDEWRSSVLSLVTEAIHPSSGAV